MHSDFSRLEIPVIVKLFVIYEITHKLIFKFPKHEKYSLGEKIENSILEAIEFFILANQTSKYEKEKVLLKANSKIELLKILFRISLNCQILDGKQYLEMENKLREMGKMTQGWIKYSRNAAWKGCRRMLFEHKFFRFWGNFFNKYWRWYGLSAVPSTRD